ncbi:hypothetical protein M426DRAFT_53020 [Hypoxylon sp. CI-4A]|nr:hypothetical protein M426DRAFT_53020 [Hypoxylon sp. CI-4A]
MYQGSSPPSPTTLTLPSHTVTAAEETQRKEKRTREKDPKRDKIRKPAEASGGVPAPTAAYLTNSAMPPFQLPYTRQMLIVIDLNGTLLFRPNKRQPTKFVERPYAREFLRYCLEVFYVVIWSSAQPKNVHRMCEQLMTPELRERCVAIWGRDKFDLAPEDYNQRVQCYKRLSKIWEDPIILGSHPCVETGMRWTQANTVLIDDSLEKARSEPFNLIPIPEFTGLKDEPEYVLPQVHDYINECARYADASAYIRTQPFKINPNWQLVAS